MWSVPLHSNVCTTAGREKKRKAPHYPQPYKTYSPVTRSMDFIYVYGRKKTFRVRGLIIYGILP